MKFNTLFLSLLINFVAVYAKADYNAKSFAIGSTHYCKNNKLSKTDKFYYAAINKELFSEKINCDNHVVALVADEKASGKYKIVRAVIRDKCDDCKVNDLRLSTKAMKELNGKKSNVIWGIIDKDGEMINGPFQPELSEKETKKVVEALGEKKINDVFKKFIENAKYMAKKNKVHLKKIANVKVEVVTKTAVVKTAVKKTTVVKNVVTAKKVITKTAEAETSAAPTSEPTTTPVTASAEATEEESGSSNIMTGAVAVSLAAGATLLLVHRRSARKNYIFGEPIDKYDGNTAKELYAKTKNGQKIRLQIPMNNNFDDIAHIQIFSPNGKESFNEPNIDVYNVHTERAIMSSDSSSLESCSSALPLPQEQPQPHSQLPLPTNDFMMAFSPIEQPDLAAIPKENIGAYDCTKNTSRFNDDPYLTQYRGDDSQEIYNSVPQSMNKTYANNSSEIPTDILLEYVEEDDYY